EGTPARPWACGIRCARRAPRRHMSSHDRARMSAEHDGQARSTGLDAEFTEPVPDGRVYRASRHIHLGDVGSQGDLRLEALSRFLEEVATDDALETDLRASLGGTWVLRRLAVEISTAPHFNDDVEFSTFCSGVGTAWAERRTDLRSPAGQLLARTVAIWVLI